jgi:hypothetical protein
MLFRPELHTQADAVFGGKTRFADVPCCHAAMLLFGGKSGHTILDAQTVSNPRVSSQSVTVDSVAFHSVRAWAA